MTLASISASRTCSEAFPIERTQEFSNLEERVSGHSRSILRGGGALLSKGLFFCALSSCIVPVQAAEEEGPYAIAGSVATVVVGVLATGFSVLSFLGSRQSQIKSVRSDVIAERDNDIQELSVLSVDLEVNKKYVRGKLLFYRQVQRLTSAIAKYQEYKEICYVWNTISAELGGHAARIDEIEKYIKTLFNDFSRIHASQREYKSILEFAKNSHCTSLENIASSELQEAIDHGIGNLSDLNLIRILSYLSEREKRMSSLEWEEVLNTVYRLIQRAVGRHIYFRFHPELLGDEISNGPSEELRELLSQQERHNRNVVKIKQARRFNKFMLKYLLTQPVVREAYLERRISDRSCCPPINSAWKAMLRCGIRLRIVKESIPACSSCCRGDDSFDPEDIQGYVIHREELLADYDKLFPPEVYSGYEEAREAYEKICEAAPLFCLMEERRVNPESDERGDCKIDIEDPEPVASYHQVTEPK